MLPLLVRPRLGTLVGAGLVAVLFAFLGIALGIVFWATDELSGPDYGPYDKWWLRAFGLLPFAGTVLCIAVIRNRLWLSGRYVIRQGPFRKVKIDLARVTFSMTIVKVEYSVSYQKVSIESPALMMRESWRRRVQLPLVPAGGNQIEGDIVIPKWMPLQLREALASAIETYATDPNKDKVAHFLRNIERSPAQPAGGIEMFGPS